MNCWAEYFYTYWESGERIRTPYQRRVGSNYSIQMLTEVQVSHMYNITLIGNWLYNLLLALGPGKFGEHLCYDWSTHFPDMISIRIYFSQAEL